jgi:hypothetical protein
MEDYLTVSVNVFTLEHPFPDGVSLIIVKKQNQNLICHLSWRLAVFSFSYLPRTKR